MKKKYCLKAFILLLTVFAVWKRKPLLAAAIPTDLTFLGEEGTFSVGSGEFLITREFDPFEWKTVPGPATANLEEEERAWACVGECEDFFYGYHVQIDYGEIRAGETVWYIGMDDDVDHRVNYFYLDGALLHTIEQGLVFSGSFVIPHDGELSLMTNDSIQARIEVPDQAATPTPTKVVAATPTAIATPTPSGGVASFNITCDGAYGTGSVPAGERYTYRVRFYDPGTISGTGHVTDDVWMTTISGPNPFDPSIDWPIEPTEGTSFGDSYWWADVWNQDTGESIFLDEGHFTDCGSPLPTPTSIPTSVPTSTPTPTPTITPSPTPTNAPPENISFNPNSGDVCHDLDGPVVEFVAKYNDTDFQSDLAKKHDVKMVQIRFGEETNPLALVVQRNEVGYRDRADLDDYGNSISLVESELDIENTSYFDLLFSLDFSSLPASKFGNYNVYMFVEDWQGDTDGWDLMGNLSIWNCRDVLITGSVYDVSLSFPNTTCAQLNPADSPPRPAVNILFDCNWGGGINLSTDGSGRYSADLIYRDLCSYSLTLAEYFTDIADLFECGGLCEGGSFGWVTIEPVNPPYYEAEINFGMSKVNDPWIQVVGGDVFSYGPISNLIPISCTNEYQEGAAECLPFIAINDPTLGFLEEGVTASKMSISYGEGLTIGNPNDWQVVDGNLWQVVGRGFRYILKMVQNSLEPEEVLNGNQNLAGISGLQDGFVGTDEVEIRFINGNLTIDRDLEVENGGLAMLIVSGNVRVDASVNRLDAVILADGSIIARDDSDRNEEQLIMEGSFAADVDGDKNGAFRNRRDLGIGRDGNSLSPAIVFRFRPDMILAILRDGRITESLYDWEEIKP